MSSGSFVDWISGIGALAASIVAVGIALRQECVAHRKDARRLRSLVGECMRRGAEIENQARRVRSVPNPADAFMLVINEVKPEIEKIQKQLELLLGISGDYPVVFGEIIRTISDSDFDGYDDDDVYARVQNIIDAMVRRRNILQQVLS